MKSARLWRWRHLVKFEWKLFKHTVAAWFDQPQENHLYRPTHRLKHG